MKNAQIWTIVFLNFVNMLGFTILIPVLPFIIKEFNANPAMYGLLLSAYSASQFFAAPFLGSLSDKYGRKPILMISHAGTMISWVIFGISYFLPNIPVANLALPLLVILLSRITDGITGGNNAVANAYLADITTTKDRAQYFGLVGASMGVAMLVGPGIGAAAASTNYGYFGVALTAFVISLFTLIWMALFLKESLNKKDRIKNVNLNPLKQINLLQKISNFKNQPIIINTLVARILFSITMSAYTSIIVLFIIDRFQLTQSQLGPFLLFIGTFLIFNQMIMVRPFIQKFGEYKTLLIGHILMTFGLIAIVLSPNLVIYIILYYFLNLGISLALPSFKSLLTNNTPKNKQGEMNGIDEAIMSLSSAIAPLIAGALYAAIGSPAFLVFAFIAFLGAIYLYSTRQLIKPAH